MTTPTASSKSAVIKVELDFETKKGHVDVDGVEKRIDAILPVLVAGRDTLNRMIEDLSGPPTFGMKGMDIQIRKDLDG